MGRSWPLHRAYGISEPEKNGMEAPQSGSNRDKTGKTLAEQIGAQIFIDAIAMACPDNPDLAVELVKKSCQCQP